MAALKVSVWRSFSSNNSASYYLVARFANSADARRCAYELGAQIRANEAELDAMTPRERGYNQELTMANLAFSEATGLDWPTEIAQGFADDTEIELAVLGRDLIVYHDYCLGFDETLTEFLQLRGATTDDPQSSRRPTLELTMQLSQVGEQAETMARALASLFEFQGNFAPELFESCGQPTAAFVGQTTARFAGGFDVDRIERLRQLFGDFGVTDYRLIVASSDAVHRVRRASNPCPECASKTIDLVAASFHDTPTDQIVCNDCGGMFAIDEIAGSDRWTSG